MGRVDYYLRENGYRLAGRVYLFLGFIFLLLPITFLILFSFQKNVYSSLPLQGWSHAVVRQAGGGRCSLRRVAEQPLCVAGRGDVRPR